MKIKMIHKEQQQQLEEVAVPATDESLSHAVSDDDESSVSLPPIDMEDIMESMVRITLAGCGGSIVGLSLEKRLESMRVNTAAGLSAAARRRRSPMATVNLPVTWGVSCMVFCSIIEASRLTSPSTILLTQTGLYQDLLGNKNTVGENTSFVGHLKHKRQPAIITMADYTIGGLFAGLAGSFGRQFQMQKSMARIHHPPGKFFGVGPGLALGLFAGCMQAATDYGMTLAEQAQQSSHPSS
jgi:hypothetical protein